jgi:hypothetical protein
MINSDRGRLLDRQVAPLLALENAGDTTGFRRDQPACSARRVHTLPGFKITNPGRLWPCGAQTFRVIIKLYVAFPALVKHDLLRARARFATPASILARRVELE